MQYKTKKLRFHTCQFYMYGGCVNGGTWITIWKQPKRRKTSSSHFVLESFQELRDKQAAVNYNGKITLTELILDGTQQNQASV